MKGIDQGLMPERALLVRRNVGREAIDHIPRKLVYDR